MIDESLTDLESLLLAREMGYTGRALKACKGQSQALLMAAAAQKYKMFLLRAGPDLPRRLADPFGRDRRARPRRRRHRSQRPPIRPRRQQRLGARFPGLFKITDGTMDTSILTGPGLGAV